MWLDACAQCKVWRPLAPCGWTWSSAWHLIAPKLGAQFACRKTQGWRCCQHAAERERTSSSRADSIDLKLLFGTSGCVLPLEEPPAFLAAHPLRAFHGDLQMTRPVRCGSFSASTGISKKRGTWREGWEELIFSSPQSLLCRWRFSGTRMVKRLLTTWQVLVWVLRISTSLRAHGSLPQQPAARMRLGDRDMIYTVSSSEDQTMDFLLKIYR